MNGYPPLQFKKPYSITGAIRKRMARAGRKWFRFIIKQLGELGRPLRDLWDWIWMWTWFFVFLTVECLFLFRMVRLLEVL